MGSASFDRVLELAFIEAKGTGTCGRLPVPSYAIGLGQDLNWSNCRGYAPTIDVIGKVLHIVFPVSEQVWLRAGVKEVSSLIATPRPLSQESAVRRIRPSRAPIL